MGKTALEPKVQQEIEEYIDHFLKPNLGKRFDMRDNMCKATCNLISQMILSKRFDYNDETLNNIIFAFNESLSVTAKLSLMENLPFSNIFLRSTQNLEHHIYESVSHPLFQSFIDDHKATIDREHPRDVIDRYILHSESAEGEKAFSFSGQLTL